mgnify:FL=1
MKNFNGNMLIVVFVIFVLIGVGGSYYYFYTIKTPTILDFEKVDQSKESTKALPHNEWKTYQDERFGFEFKYPSNLKIEKYADLDYSVNLLTQDEENGITFEVLEGENEENLSTREYVKKEISENNDSVLYIKFGNIEEATDMERKNFIFTNKKNVYNIIADTDFTLKDFDYELFQQIISTFTLPK